MNIKSIFTRLMVGIAFALPMILMSYFITQAADLPQTGDPATDECQECHQSVVETWQMGGHGQAMSDPIFVEEWNAKGKPETCVACHVTGYDPNTGTWEADGITCKACHGNLITGHPDAPMKINYTSELCGQCHTEAYFELQGTDHNDQGMACSNCHDPHAADLKAIDSFALCSSCHDERASGFEHTAHSEAGLTCINCHLAKPEASHSEGASHSDHSFAVDLDTCSQCHVYDMHTSGMLSGEEASAPPPADAMNAVDVPVSYEPVPTSPLGFMGIAALVGIAMGVILAPWLERVYRRARQAS